MIVGLAPAANGGNRTGRVFTGDSSGDWLFAALHRVGLATGERSDHAGRRTGTGVDADGGGGPLCAAGQQADRRGARHLRPVDQPGARAPAPTLRVVVALGSFGWDGACGPWPAPGSAYPGPQPRFAHGARVASLCATGR